MRLWGAIPPHRLFKLKALAVTDAVNFCLPTVDKGVDHFVGFTLLVIVASDRDDLEVHRVGVAVADTKDRDVTAVVADVVPGEPRPFRGLEVAVATRMRPHKM